MTNNKKNNLTIIAEIGSIHDGSIGNALKAIEAVAECGADVVKFQTHIVNAEMMLDAPSPPYFKDESRKDYFNRTSFSVSDWKKIVNCCTDNGILFLSSPFSIEAVDLLEEIGTSAYKIPSGEVSNLPLLEYISRKGKKVFLSSGMSNWEELDRAVNILKNVTELEIMQCSSIYPCPLEKVGINVLKEMQERYGTKVGLSDHTKGYSASLSAVAMGASVIEKHFTFSRKMYGSDAKYGLEPIEYRFFCNLLREGEIIRSNPIDKNNLTDYSEMKIIFEKSIVTAKKIYSNSTINLEDLAFKKPGDGIPAFEYKKIIGKKIKRDVNADYKLSWDDIK